MQELLARIREGVNELSDCHIVFNIDIKISSYRGSWGRLERSERTRTVSRFEKNGSTNNARDT